MGLTAPEKGINAGVKSNDNFKKGKKEGRKGTHSNFVKTGKHHRTTNISIHTV